MLNACIHKLIYWLIRNHLRSKGYEENEVFRITARLFTYHLQIVRLSQSLKWCIALHHSVLVDFSTLVCFLVWYYLFSNTAPRMSKHYFLKNHVLRYFNMQFSKNNYHVSILTFLASLTSHQVVGLFPAISSPLKLFRKIWQPPIFPYRLQHSIFGRLRLNHRVRDVYGCFP